jgi:hypothetical protein
MTKKIVLVVAMMSCLMRAGTVHAQTPAPDAQPAAAPAAAQPAVSVAPITGADLAARQADRPRQWRSGRRADRNREQSPSAIRKSLTCRRLNQIGANGSASISLTLSAA